MSIGTWIVVGLLTGFLVSKLVIRKGEVAVIAPDERAAADALAAEKPKDEA